VESLEWCKERKEEDLEKSLVKHLDEGEVDLIDFL